MSERYKVINDSVSGHCCFGFTVVDTTRPVLVKGVPMPEEFESICETFEKEDAELVCAALNAYTPTSKQQEGV